MTRLGDAAAADGGNTQAAPSPTRDEVPLEGFPAFDAASGEARASAFESLMRTRRTLRDFATTPVPAAIIDAAIATAASAPSGANKQPWHFTVITDPALKRRIREAAEAEERAFYHERAPQEWLDALAPLGTDANKPFLETAPVLIAIFAERTGRDADGEPIKHYYVPESVGIATGFLIASLHNGGLATLTHTPSPMGFLNRLCERPDNEKPFLLLVVGYPAAGARVPRSATHKKALDVVRDWR